MAFDAKVLADSRSPAGRRLTTLEATFPRFVLAEFNPHRVSSRNSASSRAIPIAKQLRRVLDDPYVPIEFGSNQPGMQAAERPSGEKLEAAEAVPATEWDNFWDLRCPPDAQPEIRLIAERMRTAAAESEPAELGPGEWHPPLIRPEHREEVTSMEDLITASAGRWARVSSLTHAGKRDLSADVELHDRLLTSGHMSPLEHPARPLDEAELQKSEWSGNFRGWRSYRKEIAGEENPLGKGGAPIGVPLNFSRKQLSAAR